MNKPPLPHVGGAGGGPETANVSVSKHSPPPLSPPAGGRGTVTLAAVSGAHGVTGEVRLKLFAENLDSLKRYKSFNNGALTVTTLRPHKDGAIARFEEVNDRNAAEKLRSILITVPREELPPLAEGEYYYSDLVDLPCISTTGEALGTCVAVENFGAGDIIEIERPDGKKFMVPMTTQAVPEWRESIVIDADFAV